MGMYDMLEVSCPACGFRLQLQSKAGFCRMDTYKWYNVPLKILADIAEQDIYCDNCNTVLEIEIRHSAELKVKGKLGE